MSRVAINILMMGMTGAGKTTISKIFEKKTVDEEILIRNPTLGVEKRTYNINGKPLHVVEYGGQELYWREWLEKRRKEVYSGRDAFIFVIDVANPIIFSSIQNYLRLSLESLKEFSPNALSHVHIFLHKSDLLPPDKRDEKIKEAKKFFSEVIPRKIHVRWHVTSIYDGTAEREFGGLLEFLAEEIEVTAEEVTPKEVQVVKKIPKEIVERARKLKIRGLMTIRFSFLGGHYIDEKETRKYVDFPDLQFEEIMSLHESFVRGTKYRSERIGKVVGIPFEKRERDLQGHEVVIRDVVLAVLDHDVPEEAINIYANIIAEKLKELQHIDILEIEDYIFRKSDEILVKLRPHPILFARNIFGAENFSKILHILWVRKPLIITNFDGEISEDIFKALTHYNVSFYNSSEILSVKNLFSTERKDPKKERTVAIILGEDFTFAEMEILEGESGWIYLTKELKEDFNEIVERKISVFDFKNKRFLHFQGDTFFEDRVLNKLYNIGDLNKLSEELKKTSKLLVSICEKAINICEENQLTKRELRNELNIDDITLNRIIELAKTHFHTDLNKKLIVANGNDTSADILDLLGMVEFDTDRYVPTLLANITKKLGKKCFNFQDLNDKKAKKIVKWIYENLNIITNRNDLNEENKQRIATYFFFLLTYHIKGLDWLLRIS